MPDQTEWVILDTETDGLSYPIHVVELAAQRMRGQEKAGDPFRVFLNHSVTIPPEATAVHGYTEEFLAKNGIDPRDAHERLRVYVEDRYVSAHFMRYDWNGALLPEWRRLRVNQIGRPGFCSWMLAKRTIPELHSHKLDLLRQHFTLPCSRPHSAIGDVESVCALLAHLVFPRLAKLGIHTFDQIAQFATLTPVLRCHCLVSGRDYSAEAQRVREEKEQRNRECRERERLIASLQAGTMPSVPDFLRSRGFISEDPRIEFQDHTFLFTGKMVWGTRPEAIRLVKQLGGLVTESKVVSNKTDYLVLGEDTEKGWTTLLHGGKLTGAVCKMIADDDSRLQLILESDFIGALVSATDSLESAANPPCA
jgi:DNA polymerase III epsilon subunit-like protein